MEAATESPLAAFIFIFEDKITNIFWLSIWYFRSNIPQSIPLVPKQRSSAFLKCGIIWRIIADDYNPRHYCNQWLSQLLGSTGQYIEVGGLMVGRGGCRGGSREVIPLIAPGTGSGQPAQSCTDIHK